LNDVARPVTPLHDETVLVPSPRVVADTLNDSPRHALFMNLVALATYNEIENLPTLVAAIRLHLPDADVLVVRSYPDLGPHRGIAALLRF